MLSANRYSWHPRCNIATQQTCKLPGVSLQRPHALQVGREGRAAVLDVREALPANWSANGTLGLGRGLARGWLGSPWVADLQQRGVAIVRQQVLLWNPMNPSRSPMGMGPRNRAL